jgi:SAM-dependent methyltransferase
VDWDLGEYEAVATQLEPAARAVLNSLDSISGHRVLDVGCGSGNGALLAARRGAEVVGLDPAPRLLDVARRNAQAEQLSINFVSGSAEKLPFDDDSFDDVLSIFALIFTPDPHESMSEIRRVLVAGGRVAISTWLPGSAMARARREIITPALQAETVHAMLAWHDPVAVGELFADHGLSASFREVGLKFVAASARSFVDDEWRTSPIWVDARSRLVEMGTFDEVDQQLFAHFATANEESDRFAITSPFLVVTAN